ncbi:hypothetical protein Tco_0958965 [Tanacetum coccineum]
MASSLGCTIMENKFRYLGVMVGAGMTRHKAWDDVILKLQSRLSKWKAKTLSIGGRLTLLKSVLGVSPLYNMEVLIGLPLVGDRFLCFGRSFSEWDEWFSLFVVTGSVKGFWKESSTLLGGLLGISEIVLLLMLISLLPVNLVVFPSGGKILLLLIFKATLMLFILIDDSSKTKSVRSFPSSMSRMWRLRELTFLAPPGGALQYLSGVILFEETLYQKTAADWQDSWLPEEDDRNLL